MSEMKTIDVPKDQRLETRITVDQKLLIARAAALSGRTVTDFANTTLVDAAKQIIREHEIISLNVKDSEAFVASLLEAPAPSARLRKAAKHYKERAAK